MYPKSLEKLDLMSALNFTMVHIRLNVKDGHDLSGCENWRKSMESSGKRKINPRL